MMVSLGIGILISAFFLLGFLFLYLSPQFGGRPNSDEKKLYSTADNYDEGKFVNQTLTEMNMDMSTIISIIRDRIKGTADGRPEKTLPVVPIDPHEIDTAGEENAVRWFGHSAFLVNLDGLKILIDPMFGSSPAPSPLLGGKRFDYDLPIAPEDLPSIDVVIYSHDHYDHLDYGSVLKLKDKVKKFYVPLGIGPHLKAWGVDEEKIHELNWGDSITYGNTTFICTPARHFSGRGLTDRNATLWCSWVIQSSSINLYFSGDTGYGPHLKAIGDEYGPFDFAMLECGQYDKRWENIHLLPEQTAMAAQDIRAQLFMPIHWGAFTLALHSWTDPVERLIAAADILGIPYIIPEIGEKVVLGKEPDSVEHWWRGL